MKSVHTVVLVCLTLSLAAIAPSAAKAQSSPCWKRLLNDYFRDGRIEGRYPVSCYQTAISRLAQDVTIYGSARDEVSGALAAGIRNAKKRGIAIGPQTVLRGQGSSSNNAAHTSSTRTLRFLAVALLFFLLLWWFIQRVRHRPRAT